ncbi:hypothetical protein DY000_02052905 [Brassica cretica]|uniref:Uncharacterized protein n=1 Tax=Brassica cretica TaxID=69181 RepID=A0ABQ7AAZ1_BRACR|nr:hypothetical protein DY000_02052905 [Brassica cretica]
MTKWKDLGPAKSTRNCRTTRSIKVTVPGSCPIELEDILKSSTKGNECSLDYGPHPIDIERGPFPKDKTRCRTEPIQPPEHEALQNSGLQRRFNRNYEFLCDVLQYFRVVRKRTSLSFFLKKEWEESWSSLDYYLLQNLSCLESGRSFSSQYLITGHISKKSDILTEVNRLLASAMCHSDPTNMWLCATEVMRQEDGSYSSLKYESKIKNSCFRVGQHITYNRFQQIQVIFTSQTYESCHPSTSKARILNLSRSINLNKPQAWEYPLVAGLPLENNSPPGSDTAQA